jgi:hypothetical protein
MRKKNFIVPHDFTDVANIALEHAIATAKPLMRKFIYYMSFQKKKKFATPKKN